METFNSNDYAWVDVSIVANGSEIKGALGVEYKLKRQKELLFGAGKHALGIQKGRVELEGTLTVLPSALSALGGNSLIDLDFDIVVSYANEQGSVKTDVLKQCSVTEIGSSIKEGDLHGEVSLPFIGCGIG